MTALGVFGRGVTGLGVFGLGVTGLGTFDLGTSTLGVVGLGVVGLGVLKNFVPLHRTPIIEWKLPLGLPEGIIRSSVDATSLGGG